jgi:hypothetical protein
MAIDDFRTHRARVRTCARLKLPTAAAITSDIARARARGFAAEREFVHQYAHAREAFSADIVRVCEGFRTSTRAHARPEFREQYARTREARGHHG